MFFLLFPLKPTSANFQNISLVRRVKADRVAVRSRVWPKCVCVRGRPAVGVELQMSPFSASVFFTPCPEKKEGGGRKSAASERGERKASIVRPRRRSQKAPSPASLPRGAAEKWPVDANRHTHTDAHTHRQRQKQESWSQGSRPSSKLLILAASPVRRAFRFLGRADSLMRFRYDAMQKSSRRCIAAVWACGGENEAVH